MSQLCAEDLFVLFGWQHPFGDCDEFGRRERPAAHELPQCIPSHRACQWVGQRPNTISEPVSARRIRNDERVGVIASVGEDEFRCWSPGGKLSNGAVDLRSMSR